MPMCAVSTHSSPEVQMDLPPIGQPPKENYSDCFYACRAAVRIKVGLAMG